MSNSSANPAEEVVLPAEVTREFLYTFFHNAYFNVHRDDVGDVFIKDAFTTWVFPESGGEHIRFMAQFAANSEMPRAAKLEYANGVNDRLKVIRAYVDADEDIGFDYYLAIEGGTTKRTIAMSVRRFIDCVRAALRQDEQNVIS